MRAEKGIEKTEAPPRQLEELAGGVCHFGGEWLSGARRWKRAAYMRIVMITVMLALWLVSPCVADNALEEGTKEVVQVFKQVGKEVKESGAEVGKGVKREGREAGQEAKKAGRSLGEWFRNAGKKIGDSFRASGQSVEK